MYHGPGRKKKKLVCNKNKIRPPVKLACAYMRPLWPNGDSGPNGPLCLGSNVANEQGTYVSFIVQRRQRAQWPAVIVAQCSLKARYTSVLYYAKETAGPMARCYYGPIFPKTGYMCPLLCKGDSGCNFGLMFGQMFQNNPAVGINNKFEEVRDR